eukprot:COSAG03_NODE_3114_length_2207_cov_3.686470_2_plen_73_part_00
MVSPLPLPPPPFSPPPSPPSLRLGLHTSGGLETNMDLYWPIITNREALAVNEAWAGDAGTLLKQSDHTTYMP